MTSCELWRIWVTVRVGWSEYLAASPPRILLAATLPRVVLQCLFYTLLGGITGGPPGRAFAFVGSLALVICLCTLVGASAVPMIDKWSSTYFRIELGCLRPGAVFALRAVPLLVEAMVSFAVCLVVVAPLVGQANLALRLLPAVPLYFLMAVTSLAAGLAAASLAVSRRDVVVGNVFTYLVVVGAAVLVPAERVPLPAAVTAWLPLRHGVLAVRALLEGRPWAGQALIELAIGVAWVAVAWVAYDFQSASVRRHGGDDFD